MRRVLLFLLALLAVSFPALAQQADKPATDGRHPQADKDIFLNQKGCPLLSIHPVTGSGFEVKNVGQTAITGYTLACFRQRKTAYILDIRFHPEQETVRPGEITGQYGFDATPPNICRSRNAMLGVFAVEFTDGTSWVTKIKAGR